MTPEQHDDEQQFRLLHWLVNAPEIIWLWLQILWLRLEAAWLRLQIAWLRRVLLLCHGIEVRRGYRVIWPERQDPEP